MSYHKQECRSCGMEIEPDITRPENLCDDCWDEKYGKETLTKFLVGRKK
jgi:hypothetical protein